MKYLKDQDYKKLEIRDLGNDFSVEATYAIRSHRGSYTGMRNRHMRLYFVN